MSPRRTPDGTLSCCSSIVGRAADSRRRARSRVGAGPFDLSAGDVDRNGTPDLVVTTPDSRTIDVLLLGPSGELAARRVLTGVGEAWGATLADVTRDGILDIVHSDYATNSISVLRGRGDGTFEPHIVRQPVSSRPQGVAAADFNHDGITDLAVASTGSSNLDILLGTSSGGLTRTTIAVGRPLNVLTAADLDSDGWIDLAAVSSSTSVLAILRGSASGFVLAGTRATGASPRGVAIGDLNLDGRLDVATANYQAHSVTVLLGRATRSCCRIDGAICPRQPARAPSPWATSTTMAAWISRPAGRARPGCGFTRTRRSPSAAASASAANPSARSAKASRLATSMKTGASTCSATAPCCSMARPA